MYEGVNDSDKTYHLKKSHTLTTCIDIANIYKCINLHQQENPNHHTYSVDEISHNILNTKILKMRIDVDRKQMDSGANKNVTDNKTIIRNFTSIKPIDIFGVEKNEVACQIVGKGITHLYTVDRSYLPVTMYYEPNCAGTIISLNAIVNESKQFTRWRQTSHLDTGSADIIFFHRHDLSKNKRMKMILANDLWFIHQPYAPLVQAANRTKMCLLR